MRTCLSALTLAFVAGSASAATIHVWSESPTPSPPYADQSTAVHTPEGALVVAQAGDIVLVHPRPENQPYEKVALLVTRPRIAIRAATWPSVRVPLSGRGCDYHGRGNTPRAIVQFNQGADGALLEGFELFGAHNDSHNAATVRINQANRVTIRDCVLRNSDMGVMSNGDGTAQAGAQQLLERCLIHSNGDFSHPGYNHNLYLGGAGVTLLGCEVHSSLTGHNVKSRAHRTTVLACYVHDSANREFDLVDAAGDTTAPDSHAVLVGNVIVKSPRCTGNRGVIHFGQDGGHAHNGTLFLIHNTIVTPFQAPVVQLSAPQARAELYNNVVWDGGVHQHRQTLVAGNTRADSVSGVCNWVAAGFRQTDFNALGLAETTVALQGTDLPWADPARGDYRLRQPVAGITDAGHLLPPAVRHLPGGLREPQRPLGWRERPDDGKPDLGAHEWVAETTRAAD